MYLYLKSFLFYLIALFTKNLENDSNWKRSINNFWYYIKCKKILRENFHFQKKYKNDNFSNVLGSKGYSWLRTDLSEKTAKIIFNKIKLNIKEYFDDKGDIIDKNIFKSFPELKNLITHELDYMFKKILKSNYKIYGIDMYYSKFKKEKAEGSQIPHVDSEPAPVFKCQFVISDTNDDNAMSIVKWNDSLPILRRVFFKINKSIIEKKIRDRNELREFKVNLVRDLLKQNKINVYKPTDQQNGLLFFFNNNSIHWGGDLKQQNNERIVLTFRVHCDHKDNLNDFFKNYNYLINSANKLKFETPKNFRFFN